MARGGTRTGRTLRLGCVATTTANGYYRAIVPLQEMARRGHTVHTPGDHTFKRLEAGDVPPWDAMHIQQMHDAEALEIMARMRRAGIAVVWDTDDNISAVRRGNQAWHRLGGRRGVKRHFEESLAVARTAHVVTTTNEHLAQIYREYGCEQVVAIENYLGPEDLGHRRTRHQGVVIGIVAAGEHEADLRKMRIGPMLEGVLAQHEGVRVVAIGVDLRLQDRHRYRYVWGVEIEELIPVESEFDIGLAPLCDTAFNRARSNIKLKEYAAAGAMWLASPLGPYRGLGEEQGGLLVDDDAWLSTLEALLENPDRRRALAQRARAWAESQAISVGVGRWQAVYRDAIERARADA